jgi:plasmid maintenance system antidote protein VapI
MAKRGFNQRQLGEALGLEESEICMLLKHKRRWTLRLIQTFGKFANMIIQL